MKKTKQPRAADSAQSLEKSELIRANLDACVDVDETRLRAPERQTALLAALREAVAALSKRASQLADIDAMPPFTLPARGKRPAQIFGSKRLTLSEQKELTEIRGVVAAARAAIAAAGDE